VGLLLEYSDQTGLFRLRPDVTLHWYCSSTPCGNSALKKFCAMRREIFRADLDRHHWPGSRDGSSCGEVHPAILPGHSVGLGQFALLLKKDGRSSTPAASSSNRQQQQQQEPNTTLPDKQILHRRKPLSRKQQRWPMYCTTDWCPPGTTPAWNSGNGSSSAATGTGMLHCCSDKMARWNVLGLQGSLLSAMLDQPLYAATVTVGRKFSAVPCRRALCCRLGRDDADYDEFFNIAATSGRRDKQPQQQNHCDSGGRTWLRC
jgi:Adenosine-deaminase (editase) domain